MNTTLLFMLVPETQSRIVGAVSPLFPPALDHNFGFHRSQRRAVLVEVKIIQRVKPVPNVLSGFNTRHDILQDLALLHLSFLGIMFHPPPRLIRIENV